MKLSRMLAMTLAGLIVSGALFSTSASASVSFDFFYSNLSSHGSWRVSTQYGRVWQPSVYSAGWNPYYDGHWEYTDVGWCWVSDYDWGPIAYHYGTWVDDSGGWVWVPGYTWAPSWVVFREGPDYIGWAPVAPGFSVGASFGFAAYPADRFVYVPCRDFLSDRIRVHAIPYARTRVIVNNTTIVKNNITVVNNVVVNRGPGVSFVERATHRRIAAVPIERVKNVNVFPGASFSREAIRIDAKAAGRGVRAAEPVSASTPLPRQERAANRAVGANSPRGRQEAIDQARPAREKAASPVGPGGRERLRKARPAHEEAAPLQGPGGQKRPRKDRPAREEAAAPAGDSHGNPTGSHRGEVADVRQGSVPARLDPEERRSGRVDSAVQPARAHDRGGEAAQDRRARSRQGAGRAAERVDQRDPRRKESPDENGKRRREKVD